jgi:hypothetical protein
MPLWSQGEAREGEAESDSERWNGEVSWLTKQLACIFLYHSFGDANDRESLFDGSKYFF